MEITSIFSDHTVYIQKPFKNAVIGFMNSETSHTVIKLPGVSVSLLVISCTLHNYFKCQNIVRLTFTNIVMVLQEMLAL